MKFKGKMDLWFWIVMLLGEALMISGFWDAGGMSVILILSFVLYNLVFLPFVFRNYVEVTEENVMVVFGFSKSAIPLSALTEVYATHNPIASSAASLDRIVLKGKNQEMICAVKDKEAFFSYLKEKGVDIDTVGKASKQGSRKLEKWLIIFTLVILGIVGYFLISGNIDIIYHEPSFTIKASYWNDKEVFYSEIDEIEYRDEEISGARTAGFGSLRLLMGQFKNEEFGHYTRYTYNNCDVGIVLKVDEKVFVINGKDKEDTKEIYEELLERCQK